MAQTQRLGTHRTSVDYRKSDNSTFVRYCWTDVVQFDDHWITLDHGNWKTPTTKTRMNQAANQFGLGYNVYQKDFDWFVATPNNGVMQWHPEGRRVTFPR